MVFFTSCLQGLEVSFSLIQNHWSELGLDQTFHRLVYAARETSSNSVKTHSDSISIS